MKKILSIILLFSSFLSFGQAASVQELRSHTFKMKPFSIKGSTKPTNLKEISLDTLLKATDNQITVAGLRALTGFTPFESYLITDLGKEGIFKLDKTDNSSADNLGTIIVDAENRRWKRIIENEINVNWFGAKADGINNDFQPVQSALNYINIIQGGTLVFNGKYRFSSQLTIYSNTTIKGINNSKIIFDDTPIYGIKSDKNFTDNTLITSNITKGSNQISVGNGKGSNFIVGNYVYIEEQTIQFGANFTGTYFGKVLSVNGDIITVDRPILSDFKTVNSAKVYYFGVNESFYNNNKIIDLSFECSTNTPNSFIGFLNFSRNNHLIVNNCSFKNCNGEAILITNCIDCNISQNTFSNIRTISGISISLSKSSNSSATNNKIEKSAFGINVSNSSQINISDNDLIGYENVYNGRGIKVQYNSMYCVVNNNKITHFSYYGIYISDSRNNAVINNKIFYCGLTGEAAIVIGGYLIDSFHDNTISQNEIDNKGRSVRGILVYAAGASAEQTYISITNNRIINTNNAIVIFTSSNNISNNVIFNFGVALAGIEMAGNTSKNVIIGNIIKNEGTGYAISTANSNGNNIVKLNDTLGENIYLHSLDIRDSQLLLNSNVNTGEVLQVTGDAIVKIGNLEVSDPSKGIILKSTNGSRWILKVNNSGQLIITAQ